MSGSKALRELLAQVLLTREPATVLYKICQMALEMTGARNAMILLFDNELGYMTMRAGAGPDWRPELLGKGVFVGVEEQEGITAYVAATGKSYVSGDVRKEKRYKKLFETSRSELAAPVFDRHGRVRGAQNVESDEVNKFGEADMASLELLATVAGILMDRQDARVREEALEEVGSALDVAQTEEDLLQRVAEVTRRVLPVHAHSIFLWDEDVQAFILRDTVGSATLGKDARYLPGEGCTGWVCQQGEAIRLDNPSEDARWLGRYLEFPIEEIRAYLAVPIISTGRCIGCMRAIRRLPRNPHVDNRFTEDDTRLLSAIAEQLGTGLAKIRSLNKLVTSERMAAWGELSARSSHMIGNRVFALAGDISELRRRLNEDPISKEAMNALLDALESGIRRLEEILLDFRDFVTATKLSPEERELNEVVREAVSSVAPASEDLELAFELDESLPPFLFDPQKIERAVSELVGNAIYFMGKGKVTVRTRRAEMADLAAAVWEKKPVEGFVCIEVEDEGPGVPEEQKSKVFDPYQTSRAKGMGLGLSIVKGIADAHGGTVFEAGEEGKGARFVILLPIRTGAESGRR
ncbi:MAG: GAF domain-containing protein [Armatimonadetes bacterium]|nr:GAF domain-containing protein [Armatimonadota bacterium]